MPSGGQKALNDRTMEFIWGDYQAAVQNNLVHEWLQYFIGGLAEEGKLNNDRVIEHSSLACIEWDF